MVFPLLSVHRAQELEGWPLAMQRICCLKFWFPRSGGFPVPALELCRWRRVRHLYLSYFQTILIVHTQPSEKKHFHRFDKELFFTIQEFAHALLILTREAIKYLPLVDNTFVTKDKIKYQHTLKICRFNGQQTEKSFLRPKEKKRHKKRN